MRRRRFSWTRAGRVKISNEQREPREAVLTVELDDADVEPYLDQAYRRVARRLAIPGFRKGKVPRRVIEQMYGRAYLLNEAFDPIVNEFTSKAVEAEGLLLGGIPSVNVSEYDPFRFIAVVPLPPSIELGDVDAVRVPMQEAEASDDAVESVILRMRMEQGVWEPVDDAVRMGDLVNMTMVGWTDEDGERREFTRSDASNYIPRDGVAYPVPGMDEALVGMSAGERRAFEIPVSADSRDPELAGKTARFDAEVHSVKRRSLPDADDEFAKSVGEGFETVAELREQIRENLLAGERQRLEFLHQEAVLARLTEEATFAVSPLIIERELERYVNGRIDAINSGRATVEEYREYLSWQGLSDEEALALARPNAEERLKRAHVLREMTDRLEIAADDEEVDEEIEVIVSAYGEHADAQRKHFADQESRESIRRLLAQRKTRAAISAMALRADPAADEPPPAESSESADADGEAGAA